MMTNGAGDGAGRRRLARGRASGWLLVLLLAGGWLLPVEASAFWPFSRSSAEPAAVVEEKVAASKPSPTEARLLPVDDATWLYHRIGYLGAELFASLREPDLDYSKLQGGVIVLTFVDQKKLTRTTSFGRYLAEQLMNDLQQRQVPVVELRKSREVRIQAGQGEYGLSREPAEIRDQARAAAMLTGTYTITPEQVIVHARIIDNRDALLLASATAVIPRTPVVNALLADPVSGRPRDPEPMYMKRLEF